MTRITDSIIDDHRELEDYYNRITGSHDEDEQTRYQSLFVWELARHSVGEELVVYPVMEKKVDAGKVLADRDRVEHQKAKELLYKFQKLSANNAEFIPTLEKLFSGLKKHMKEEEEEDLVKLEQVLSSDDSEKLAKSFERTKKFVPTHSHPSAPDKPPFETAVGLLSAPIDKVADLFKKFPQD